MVTDLLPAQEAGFRAGSAAFGGGMELALRSQELRSKQALQQLQEQQTAAQTALVLQHVQQLKQGMEQQAQQLADAHKAELMFQGLKQLGMPEDQAIMESYGELALRGARSPEEGLAAGMNLQKFKDSIAAKNFTPTFTKDPSTGAVAVKTAPDKWQAFAPPKEAQPATSTVGKLLKEYNDATINGDQFAQQAYKAAIDKAITPTGMTLKTNPDGTFELVQGPIKTSTAAATKAQEENLSGEAALEALDKATAAIRQTPTAIGPVGVARSAMERASGILNPNEDIQTPVTDTRQKASLAFSRVAKSLRVDSGNMSRYELSKLEQAGDVMSITEAPQTALKKLSNLQDAVMGQQLRRLRFLGQKVPDPILRRIPSSEIPDLVRDGLISKEDALRWHSLK